MKLLFTSLFNIALAVTILSSTAQATTYNAVTDFSSSNPSGPWSYGYGVTGTSFSSLAFFASTPSLSVWYENSGRTVPDVGLNTSGSPVTTSGSNVLVPGVLFLHPGPSTDVIVQWTAPGAGTYDISGMFELLDIHPTGVIGEVFDNATQIYSRTLTGPAAAFPSSPGGSESFSLTETLAKGAVISFGVNNDGNYDNDSTGFNATITTASTATPEPASVLLFAAGLISIYTLKSRRKNNPN